jgi:transcriptional regulator with GAF, ATPase, and Fis domain
MEAALFGHERGAFTGANDARQGVFEEAHKGTLLIDEIGDLSLELQAKLLRALERSEVRRIGGKSWTKVDVRVIAATRRDLDAAVQAGRFRDDLFYRIAVARIELPPLRRREGDIPLLATHFWNKLSDKGSNVPPDFLEQVGLYAWPGNVRELYNAVARRVALGELAGSVGLAARPKAEESPSADAVERVLSLDLPMPRAREKLVEEFELRYVERVLSQHGGNVTKAAAASGLALRYFQLVRARAKGRKG